MARDLLIELISLGAQHIPEHIWGLSLCALGCVFLVKSHVCLTCARYMEVCPPLSASEAVRQFRAGGSKPLFVVMRGVVSTRKRTAAISCGKMMEERAAMCWTQLVQIPLNSLWNELFWLQPAVNERTKEVPFEIGGIPVDADGLQYAPRCVRAEVSTVMQDGVVSAVQGIESALVEGTTVTVTAEMATSPSSSSQGMIVLRRPTHNVLQHVFHVTEHLPHDLINSLKTLGQTWRWIGITLGFAGVVLIGHAGFVRWRTAKEARARQQHSMQLIQALRNNTSQQGRRHSMNESEGDEDLCIVCCERPRDCLVLPCKHLICCLTCVRGLMTGLLGSTTGLCPVCRVQIRSTLKINIV